MPVLTPATIDPTIFTGSTQPALAAGDELLLRPWRIEDAPAVLQVYDDQLIRQWHARSLVDVGESRKLIIDWRSGWRQATGASWAIVDHDQLLLGRVAVKSFDLHEGVAAVAYWTAPSARGRGVCPRAVRAATEWAFRLGFHRLQLEHSVLNQASCRAAEKAGYPAEGTRRSAALHPDGWHDMHVHALVRPE